MLLKKNKLSIHDELLQLFKNESLENNLLVKIITILRKKDNQETFRTLLLILKENPTFVEKIKFEIQTLNIHFSFHEILTETAIIKSFKFREEVFKRIISKIIPFQAKKNSFEYTLNQLFHSENDILWITKISFEDWKAFIHLFELKFDTNLILEELFYAANLLCQRMCGSSLDSEILKILPEFDMKVSPFQELEHLTNELKYNSSEELFIKIQETENLCQNYIQQAYENTKTYGISLNLNQQLLKISTQLERVAKIIDFIKNFQKVDSNSNSISLFIYLVELHCKQNNIKTLVNQSTQLITYEITQHTAKTGEHYISNTKKDYYKMLISACGGGLIVGFLCVFKLLLSKVQTSDFGHAFLYSLNYSFGFILIYLLGFTLATKQPAMTAAAMVKIIEKGLKSKNKMRHLEFAIFFSKLFRTQFVAFFGNVIMAFPVSLLLIFGIDFVYNTNIAAQKSDILIKDLSPIHSLLIFHAAIAGVFLFLSGIISGAISNRNKYYNFYYRIAEHPWLKITFGKEKTKKISSWFQKYWPGVASNFWFGVFMGTVSSIGAFIGLNLDIRHITFGSGNLALGLYGSEFQIYPEMLFWSIFGIFCIGLINFIVSFLLSLYVAFKSRNIPKSELKFLFISVWQYFKVKPFSFFFP